MIKRKGKRKLKPASREVLAALSRRDFAKLGLADLAYIRPVTIDGRKGFSAHAADGTQILLSGKYQEAAWALQDYDLVAVSVH